ncbi:MAG: hypothetical protein R2813_05505 [Flavobacteriales bacterium]
MDILYSLIWVPILLLAVLKIKLFRMEGVKNALITGSFLAKISGAFLLQWLYTYYYPDRSTADIYRFFDDGILLNNVSAESPLDYFMILFNLGGDGERFRLEYFEKMNSWIKPFESGFYNDNHLMIKLNSLFSFFSSNIFEVHNLLFGTMAFIGTVLLIKALTTNFKALGLAMAFITMLPTSILLVNGGLKESVMSFGAGIFLYSIFRMKTLSHLPWLVLSATCLISIKPYFLAASILALVAHFITKQINWNGWKSWLFWFMGAGCGIVVFHMIGIDLAESVADKRQEFINHALDIQAGSRIELAPIMASWFDILIETPAALMNTLFMPLPWQVSSVAEMMMVFENIVFLFILIWSIYKYAISDFEFEYLHLVLQICLPVVVLIGLISPVLGATMRYRAPFLMLLIIVMIPSLLPVFKTSTK